MKIEKFIPDIKFGQPTICTYCGLDANTIDHVIPISFYGIKRKDLNNDTGVRTFACQSCNSTLGSRVFLTFKARLAYISACHKKKSKEAHTPWSEKELEELDYNLASFIRQKKNLGAVKQTKAEWIGSIGFYRTIRNLSEFKELYAHERTYNAWLSEYFKGYF